VVELLLRNRPSYRSDRRYRWRLLAVSRIAVSFGSHGAGMLVARSASRAVRLTVSPSRRPCPFRRT